MFPCWEFPTTVIYVGPPPIPPSPPPAPPPFVWNSDLDQSTVTDLLSSPDVPPELPDSEPPVVVLYGDASLTIRMGTTFHDPGAYVIDGSATTLTSTGVSTIETALQASDPSALGELQPDGIFGPWIITYRYAHIRV